MMDPASSSDDESSSSLNEVINRNDDDDSSDDNNDDAHHVSNFNDLPTDDSEMESDSDDDSDDDDDNDEKIQAHDDDDEDDIPLAERVAKRAQLGRRYNDANREDRDDDGGKKRLLERKNRAITVASERLRKARKDNNNGSDSSSVPSSSDDDDDSSVEHATSYKNGGQPKKKKSKHAPTEMSSKRREFFARGRPDLNSSGIGVSVGANKYKPRDPRMVSLSGHLDDDVFEKRYDFLDEVQEAEIDKLKKRVSAWKTNGKKGQKARKKLGLTQGNNTFENDQEELTRILQEVAERKKASLVRAAKRTVKQKIRTEVASGKGVYYPKRAELRKMELEAKFEEIRKRGGDEAVDKAIAKRRKKNVAKSHKLMPSHMVK